MHRLILTHERPLELPNGLSHTEIVRRGGPDGLRLRDYGDVVQVHLEALLDQDTEEVEPQSKPPSADLFTLNGIHR
jgi:hypothetical protein